MGLSSIIHHALDSYYVLGSKFSPPGSLSGFSPSSASPFLLLKKTRLPSLRSFQLLALCSAPLLLRWCFIHRLFLRTSLQAGRESCPFSPLPPGSTSALSTILSAHPVIPTPSSATLWARLVENFSACSIWRSAQFCSSLNSSPPSSSFIYLKKQKTYT